jgi:hypothetical protein
MRRNFLQIVLFAISALLIVALMPSSTGAAPGQATAEATGEASPEAPPSAKAAPLKWPLTPATAAQVNEVRACKIEDLSKERYPESMPIEKLRAAYEPETACDWAVLAAAYGSRKAESDAPPPAQGVAAFQTTISKNPAFAFTLPMLQSYFGVRGLVDVPPFASKIIANPDVTYNWSGLGDAVKFSYVVSRTSAGKFMVKGQSG